MIILEDQNPREGLKAGLGFRIRMPKLAIGKFIKRNIKSAGRDVGRFAKKYVNLKNVLTVASIAVNFIPGGQAVGIGLKLMKLAKLGKLAFKAVKLAKSPLGKALFAKLRKGTPLKKEEEQFITQMAVEQDQDPKTPNVLTPEQFSSVAPNLQQAPAPLLKDTPSTKVGSSNSPTNTISENTTASEPVEELPTEEQIQTISKVKDIPVENLKEEVKNLTPANTTPQKSNLTIPLVIGAVAVGGLLLVSKSKK